MEAAAVDTLLALTLKLSEKAFKPRFLRFLEWAATAPPGADQRPGPPLGRAAALFGAVHALTSRLRCETPPQPAPPSKMLARPQMRVLRCV